MPTYQYKGQYYDLSETDPAKAKAKIQAHLGEATAAPTETTTPPAQPYQRQVLESIPEQYRAGFESLLTEAHDPRRQAEVQRQVAGIERQKAEHKGALRTVASGIELPAQFVGGYFGGVPGGTAAYTAARQLTGKLGLREEEPVLTSATTGLLTELGGKLLGKGVEKVVQKATGKGAVKAPSIEELKQESNALRTKMYSTDQQYNPNQLKVEIQQALETAQPRFPVEGSTEAAGTQNALKVLDRIITEHNQGIRITKVDELDNLRRELSAVANRGGNDGLYATQAIKKLDKFVDDVGGDAAKAWKEARALETKAYRSQDIQNIVTKAELSKQATSSEIRNQFQKIAVDKNEMKYYSPEQQAVIKQIADGTATEKTFELIGKMAPKSVTWSRLLSLVGLGGGAAVMGGVPGILAVGAGLGTGITARGAANALAKSRVNMLDELIRGGQMPQTIQLPQTTQRLFPAGVNVLANQLQGQQ